MGQFRLISGRRVSHFGPRDGRLSPILAIFGAPRRPISVKLGTPTRPILVDTGVIDPHLGRRLTCTEVVTPSLSPLPTCIEAGTPSLRPVARHRCAQEMGGPSLRPVLVCTGVRNASLCPRAEAHRAGRKLLCAGGADTEAHFPNPPPPPWSP